MSEKEKQYYINGINFAIKGYNRFVMDANKKELLTIADIDKVLEDNTIEHELNSKMQEVRKIYNEKLQELVYPILDKALDLEFTRED